MSQLEDLDPGDLEAIAVIYDNIRVLRRTNAVKMKAVQKNAASDKQLAAEFDSHLQTVMGQLSMDIEQEEGGGASLESGEGLGKGAHILNAKAKLMEILIEKMSEYLQAIDGKGSVEILQGICSQFNIFIQQSLELG